MKLRDLVANSLPRVRGKKKKTPAAPGGTPTTGAGSVAVPDVSANRSGYDKNQNRFQSSGPRGGSRDSSLESQNIPEASWRGNALYRGLDASRAVEVNSRIMTSSFTSSHGIVASHSAEGFSSQLMMMSRSYDSRMAVSDYNGSCSQMSSISETGMDPYTAQQQYYHCYYHRHNHHHHHHYRHIHAKPMTPLVQNQQEINASACHVSYQGRYKPEETPKSEPGFFRKSIASFRGIRKHSNKASKDGAVKPNANEPMRCSVCPYPETNISSTERKSSDKRPAKPKRKGLKGFSRSKENKEVFMPDKCDKSWYSDNDSQNVVSPVTSRADVGFPVFSSMERPRVRECSVESCSSRLYGSREGSSVREMDLVSFDSGSLSGYESDLPRSKVHRSRSRIKTNPWLPSPQPSLSGGRRAENCDLQETNEEDIFAMDEQASRFPRSASFEHQRSGIMPLQYSTLNDSSHKSNGQRQRSLTPIDVKATMSLDRATKSPPAVKKSTWWTVGSPSDNTTQRGGAAAAALNDLNVEAPKSRPTSIVSPNSEFVMLADNLEQLANNISFEYEEMLESTLESVSVCQEDGQASIQELLTDEENGNAAKKGASAFLKSDGCIHNAHSPDSGIGGLGSSDGDDALTPGTHNELKVVSMDCSAPSGSFGSSNRNPNLCATCNAQNSWKSAPSTQLKSPTNGTMSFNDNGFRLSTFGYKSQNLPTEQKGRKHKCSVFDEDSSATVSESDIDNTSYHDHVQSCGSPVGNVSCSQKKDSPLPRCKTETHGAAVGPTLMVEERLDIHFQPPYRHTHGTGIVMGAGASVSGHCGQFTTTHPLLPAPCGAAESSAVVPRRVTRPSALRTNPSALGMGRKLNDIEKSSSQTENGRPWSDEFDLARNITINECVESPTENWQCDGHFSMCSSQDTVILEQRLNEGIVEASKEAPQAGRLCSEDDCIKNEELVVRLDDNDCASTSQNTAEMASENTSLMDCNLDKLETGSHDTSFEMSDACVQTDFDDDFSRWDEVDTLESLEENALDPAESTRIWLLTGNMQGSADTGYSSLTRDSQILMDEDTLFLAGELEERAAAERLSFGEYSNRSSSGDRTPRNSALLEINCQGIVVPVRKRASPSRDSLVENENASTEKGSSEAEIQEESSKNAVPSLVTPKSQSGTGSQPQTTRGIPQSTVNEMFSNIESQFQEIFQQIYDHKNLKIDTDSKRNSSDSSDSTVKSSDSDGPIAGGIPKSALRSLSHGCSLKDHETGEPDNFNRGKPVKAEEESDMYTDHDYVNVPSSKKSKNSAKSSVHGNDSSDARERDSNGNLTESCSTAKCERPSGFQTACSSSNLQNSKNNIVKPKPPPRSDSADYLEFLRDAPLNRSHLKRPLFLVPGVGPVDMSSSEHMNMFVEDSKTAEKNASPSSHSCPSKTSSSMSPLVAHSGKKLKYKKGNHKTLEDKTLQDSGLCEKDRVLHSKPKVSQEERTVKGTVSTSSKASTPKSLSVLPFKSKNASSHSHHDKKPTRPQNLQSVPSSSSSSVPSAPSSSLTVKPVRLPLSAEELAQIDGVTRSLAERVMSLRREKDIVYRKIQEAQQDEASRQEQRLQLQKTMHAQRKEALLETLHELRDRLQEQSEKLKLRQSATGTHEDSHVGSTK